MTTPLSALAAVTGVTGTAAATAATDPVAASAVTGPLTSTVAGTAGTDFGTALAAGLENLQRLQSTSDSLAVQAATGDLTDVHDYMIAATEASVATQLTVAVRNKAVDAFNEIMRMQA